MGITLLTFAVVVFVTVVTPGPTVLLAMTNGSRYGMRSAGIGTLGAVRSDVVLITAATLGLGAVLATSAFWFSIVKWLGVAYLTWLGQQMLRSAGASGGFAEGASSGSNATGGASSRVFRKCCLVAVTNPKGYLFFAAFLPQFVDPAQPMAGQYASLALVFILIDLLVMLAYATFGLHAGRFLTDSGTRWLERGCGITLLLLAFTLSTFRRASV